MVLALAAADPALPADAPLQLETLEQTRVGCLDRALAAEQRLAPGDLLRFAVDGADEDPATGAPIIHNLRFEKPCSPNRALADSWSVPRAAMAANPRLAFADHALSSSPAAASAIPASPIVYFLNSLSISCPWHVASHLPPLARSKILFQARARRGQTLRIEEVLREVQSRGAQVVPGQGHEAPVPLAVEGGHAPLQAAMLPPGASFYESQPAQSLAAQPGWFAGAPNGDLAAAGGGPPSQFPAADFTGFAPGFSGSGPPAGGGGC